MNRPKILLATLCLNEMEWLDKLYTQHKAWEGLVSWVFVEAADTSYTAANPQMVTKDGLSVDGTTEFLEKLAREDNRICHIKFGHSKHADVAQGKAPARSAYLQVADYIHPDWIIILDADEFYTNDAQERVSAYLDSSHAKSFDAVCFRQREIWRAPSIVDKPLFSYEVIGGLWKMHHCHCWKWRWGLTYGRSHVWPQNQQGKMMNANMDMADRLGNTPEWVHLGWASQASTRLAKTRYYVQRKEGVRDGRQRHMVCRMAWENWKPGMILPYGAAVVPYHGPIPEIFKSEVNIERQM